MGRPTKYKSDYCALVENFIGEDGESVTQLAKHLKVSKSTIYKWAETNKDFSDALTRAQDWAEAIWEKKFIGFMVDKNVNAALIKLYFANRFKWYSEQKEDNPPASIVINHNLHSSAFESKDG